MEPSSQGIPLSDRGFRYGQHFFETIAVRNGSPLFIERHVNRLVRAAHTHHFGEETRWQESLHNFLTTTHFEDGLIRVFLTAGEGSLADPVRDPKLCAFWEAALFPSCEERMRGIKVVSLNKHHGNEYWGVKNGNYWDHICALKEALKAGASEGLVFDQKGILISATMANVILWLEKKEGLMQCVTPPTSSGARDGVVLSWACEEPLIGISPHEITRSDLSAVRALAITNSRLGVMPVYELDGVRLSEYARSLALANRYHSLYGV